MNAVGGDISLFVFSPLMTYFYVSEADNFTSRKYDCEQRSLAVDSQKAN